MRRFHLRMAALVVGLLVIGVGCILLTVYTAGKIRQETPWLSDISSTTPPAGVVMEVFCRGKSVKLPIWVEKVGDDTIDFYFLNGTFYGDAVPNLKTFDVYEPEERAVLLFQDEGMLLLQPNGSGFYPADEWHCDDEHFPGPDFPNWVETACRTFWGERNQYHFLLAYLLVEEGVYVIDRRVFLELIAEGVEPGLVEVSAAFYAVWSPDADVGAFHLAYWVDPSTTTFQLILTTSRSRGALCAGSAGSTSGTPLDIRAL